MGYSCLVPSSLSFSPSLPSSLATSTQTVEGETHPADAWLGAMAHGTMETYVNSILQITSLSEDASQQLAADIGVDRQTDRQILD